MTPEQKFEQENTTLDAEVHPMLTTEQLRSVREHRRKLLYKTPESTQKLLYEWAKTGKLSFREFQILSTYIFTGT